MGIVVPIETELGFINYRDTIHLDKVESGGGDWIFIGEFFADHLTNYHGPKSADTHKFEGVPFKFVFKGVQTIFTYDVDLFCDSFIKELRSYDYIWVSSFFKVENSGFLKNFPIRDDGYKKDEFKHFCLATYDTIFEMIAHDYELIIDEKKN